MSESIMGNLMPQNKYELCLGIQKQKQSPADIHITRSGKCKSIKVGIVCNSKIIINVSLTSNLTYVTSFGVYQDGSAVVSTSGQTNSNEANTSVTTYKNSSAENLLHAQSFNVILNAGSTSVRTYDVRGTSGWSGTPYALTINDRGTTDMASFSTMVIYEVAQ